MRDYLHCKYIEYIHFIVMIENRKNSNNKKDYINKV